MKKGLFLVVILSFVLFACGPIATTDTAIEYNDEMISILDDVDATLVDLLDEIDYGDEEAIFDAKDTFEEAINEAEKTVNDMEDFDGKDDYKKETLKFIDMYRDILENEIADLIDYSIYFDELTDEEWEYYYDITDVALEKYDAATEEFSEFQEGFAKEWDFVLE